MKSFYFFWISNQTVSPTNKTSLHIQRHVQGAMNGLYSFRSFLELFYMIQVWFMVCLLCLLCMIHLAVGKTNFLLLCYKSYIEFDLLSWFWVNVKLQKSNKKENIKLPHIQLNLLNHLYPPLVSHNIVCVIDKNSFFWEKKHNRYCLRFERIKWRNEWMLNKKEKKKSP